MSITLGLTLGWKDRFGDPAYGARHREAASRAGARVVYTPQVLLDGREFLQWRRGGGDKLPAAANQRPPRAELRIAASPAASQIAAHGDRQERAIPHAAPKHGSHCSRTDCRARLTPAKTAVCCCATISSCAAGWGPFAFERRQPENRAVRSTCLPGPYWRNPVIAVRRNR
jgi:hypothetical protein